MPEWVIRTSDNLFLRDKGAAGIIAGEAVVTVATTPSPRLTRYDSTAPTGIRMATAQEIAAYDAVLKDAKSDADINTNKLIQAVARLDFEERQKLTVRAGQTLRTAPECLDRIKAIYRSLLDA